VCTLYALLQLRHLATTPPLCVVTPYVEPPHSVDVSGQFYSSFYYNDKLEEEGEKSEMAIKRIKG